MTIMDRVVWMVIMIVILIWVLVIPRRTGNPSHWRLVDLPRLKVQIQFEWQDLWVGVFVRKTQIGLHCYICLIPLFPIHITIARLQG